MLGRHVLHGALIAGIGCAEPQEVELGVHGWAALDAEEDPLASHRPAAVLCPPSATGVEGGVFEVQTGICTYYAGVQQEPVSVAAGDRLVGAIWHEGLDAPDPAEAHVAVLIGDAVVWEATRPVPDEARLMEIEVVLSEDLDGEVVLHLHNHGFNVWNVPAWVIEQRGR